MSRVPSREIPRYGCGHEHTAISDNSADDTPNTREGPMSLDVVRCKFRCLHTTQHHDGLQSVRLGPVMNRPSGEYAVPEENKRFWKATPSGNLELSSCEPGFREAFRAGNYYYLDIEHVSDPLVPAVDGPAVVLEVDSVERRRGGSAKVGFAIAYVWRPHEGQRGTTYHPPDNMKLIGNTWRAFTFEMTIDNPAAADFFDVGQVVRVRFTEAPE